MLDFLHIKNNVFLVVLKFTILYCHHCECGYQMLAAGTDIKIEYIASKANFRMIFKNVPSTFISFTMRAASI